MKSAEEWMKGWANQSVRPRMNIYAIREIQANALRHAAGILGNGRSERTPQSIRTAWADVLNAEAEKLEPK